MLKRSSVGREYLKPFVAALKDCTPRHIALREIVPRDIASVVFDNRIFHNRDPGKCSFLPLNQLQRKSPIARRKIESFECRLQCILLQGRGTLEVLRSGKRFRYSAHGSTIEVYRCKPLNDMAAELRRQGDNRRTTMQSLLQVSRMRLLCD